MAKQTFTTGQVLTAAQMTDLQATAMGGGAATAKTANYVLVAADAGTTVAMNAAGATTITVNTGLFAAGDTVFIQNIGAGVCTITAGTATVNTAGALALPQYDAGILYFTSASAAIFYDYIQVGAASPLTTKGDLYTYSTSDTRLGVGANNTVLTAASGEATGLKWAVPNSLAWSQLATGSLTGASVSITGLSSKEYYVYCDGWSHDDAGNQGLRIQFNSDTGSNYGTGNAASGGTSILLCAAINPTGTPGKTIAYVLAAGDTEEVKTVLVPVNSSSTQGGNYFSATAITSIQLFPNAGNFDAGTYYIYGRS